ncbi:hypothetical protein EDC96DRAFT_508158 [Choanephora cucurbitarum]|nr:hypothetical protein EDC96DRAFT_508158 [Choanephora cucurbitarum]
MQASLDLIDPPPPYEAYAESPFCASDTNFSAWPSDYYRKTRRIDLEQFYHDVLQASIQQTSEDISYPRNSSDSYSSATTDESISYSKPKQVTFCPNPPVVYEYEPEYDDTDNIDSDVIQKPTGFKFDEGWPGRAKRASTSSGFLDFKSKIEAQLSAVNDASVMSQINANTADLNHSPPLTTLPNYHPKGFLDFRSVLNPCQQDSPKPEPNQDHRFSFSVNTTSNKWLDTFSKLKKSNSLLLSKSR